MHLTKHQEAAESTRIEFERMSAELSRVLEKLERSENEKEVIKQSFKNAEKNTLTEKHFANLEAEARQLVTERYISSEVHNYSQFRLFIHILACSCDYQSKD